VTYSYKKDNVCTSRAELGLTPIDFVLSLAVCPPRSAVGDKTSKALPYNATRLGCCIVSAAHPADVCQLEFFNLKTS